MSDKTTVEIVFDDATYLLQPKLSAMKAVNRMAGGYVGAFRALQQVDMDAMVLIIAAGTGSTGKAVVEIERRVYQRGGEPLMKDLARFVSICAAGGRDPDEVAPKASDDEDEAASGKN